MRKVRCRKPAGLNYTGHLTSSITPVLVTGHVRRRRIVGSIFLTHTKHLFTTYPVLNNAAMKSSHEAIKHSGEDHHYNDRPITAGFDWRERYSAGRLIIEEI
jgi:hypothetical protein